MNFTIFQNQWLGFKPVHAIQFCKERQFFSGKMIPDAVEANLVCEIAPAALLVFVTLRSRHDFLARENKKNSLRKKIAQLIKNICHVKETK